jgi:glycosyltransferase involved in cell wall biosynthesis
MKILLVGNHFSDLQHNVNVWKDLVDHLRIAGHSVLTTSGNRNKLLRLIDMLTTICWERKNYQVAEVDVFSGLAFLWSFLSAGLLKLLRKPFILTLHGGNLPAFAAQHPQAIKRLLTWADAVVAPSDYLKQKLSEYRSDIKVIPNGLDICNYHFRLRENPEPKPVWLRAFHKIYNPSLAPQVIKLLKSKHIDVHLLMVGPDKGDGSLQDMLSTAHNLEVQNQIEVIQGVPKQQVPEILMQGDIFLNTTNYDNTPVSVIEAMASGCCIVTTNVGGIPYLLEDGIDALLVPPNDPDAMANAVLRVLTESGLAEKLSVNARRKAEQFDWSIVLPQWEELFEELTHV